MFHNIDDETSQEALTKHRLAKLVQRFILINSLINDNNISKRSFHTDYSERILKGKRLNNKNIFSSGLQGVWGLPGK